MANNNLVANAECIGLNEYEDHGLYDIERMKKDKFKLSYHIFNL
jgi:hypothetical protein